MTGAIAIASGFIDRTQGFLKRRPPGTVLVLVPCRSIHTFWMKSFLDIAFVSKQGKVLKAERDVAPGRVIKAAQAQYVLERISVPTNDWVQEGQILTLEPRWL